MTRRRVHLVVLAGVLLLVLASSGQARAGVVVKAPVAKSVTAPPAEECYWDSAGGTANDLYIIDGVWFQCVCERFLFTGELCLWYEIVSPARDPQAWRKKAKRHGKLVRVARPVAVHA